MRLMVLACALVWLVCRLWSGDGNDGDGADSVYVLYLWSDVMLTLRAHLLCLNAFLHFIDRRLCVFVRLRCDMCDAMSDARRQWFLCA